MLRLIHNQTVTGGLLVDDIDDGLPNKEVYRLAGESDPKAYARDGYANKTKQKCYVPFAKATDTTLPGFIDLNQTDRVTLSAGKGKIKKMQTVSLLNVVSFLASDVVASVVTAAQIANPMAGDVTITGTTFLSVSPNITKVVITGSGAVTLTTAQIIAGGGSVGATSIVIKAASVPGIAATTSSVKVVANDLSSNVFVITV